MSNAKFLFTAVSIGCVLAASPPYIIDTIRGKTRPERATWLIFAILGVIAVVSQLAAGATWSVIFTVVDSLAGVVVLGLSVRYGVGGWTLQDRIALVIAGVGVGLALTLKNPLYSILGVILADASGMVLTLRKAYNDPGSETSISWLLSGIGGFAAVLVVNRLSLDQLLYPIYLAAANCGVVVCQYFGSRYNKQQ
jgi:hypothetical protein